ncbi:hypothetical protein AGLY_017449 [Aphis glycines]|uniref:Uncharacterized protein n=1 Tax=Aphis glycines TaxID=307491 RepID=A0A6G0SV45_APHGL|nr:hypothetical protein AGLY_017449 [Aphis glycines]
MKLEEAFKLIPLCTGENDIYPFINACDMAVNLVEDKCTPTLVEYITTRLCSRALETIKYKNFTKWVYIKNYLSDAFEDTTTASILQIQLNSIKMCYDKNVNDYFHRVKKLYYKLYTACTLNKEESEAKGNVKETISKLLEALKEYHIVTEIAKQYNLTLEINYEIKHINLFFLWGGVMGYEISIRYLRDYKAKCYCTFSNSCPNLQQQQQGHLVSPRRRQLDVNKRRTTIYKGARRPATADVPKLSTTEHFHDTQPLILFVTCIEFICNKDIFRY